MGFVYKITNTINGKIYVGQTVQSISSRFSEHCTKFSPSMSISCAIRKYGRDNFVVEQLEECENCSLSERERYWIALLESTKREVGYNILEGGQELFGARNPMYGKKHSDETKDKIRNKNSKLSEAQVKEIIRLMECGASNQEMQEKYNVSKAIVHNIRNGNTWRYLERNLNKEEYRSKMMSGSNNPFYGKTHSDATRQKVAASNRRRKKT